MKIFGFPLSSSHNVNVFPNFPKVNIFFNYSFKQNFNIFSE